MYNTVPSSIFNLWTPVSNPFTLLSMIVCGISMYDIVYVCIRIGCLSLSLDICSPTTVVYLNNYFNQKKNLWLIWSKILHHFLLQRTSIGVYKSILGSVLHKPITQSKTFILSTTILFQFWFHVSVSVHAQTFEQVSDIDRSGDSVQ